MSFRRLLLPYDRIRMICRWEKVVLNLIVCVERTDKACFLGIPSFSGRPLILCLYSPLQALSKLTFDQLKEYEDLKKDLRSITNSELYNVGRRGVPSGSPRRGHTGSVRSRGLRSGPLIPMGIWVLSSLPTFARSLKLPPP